MAGEVEQREQAAEAVTEKIQLVVAGDVEDLVDDARQVVIDVGLEGVVGLQLVGDAPVDEEHVEAAVQHRLHEAVAGREVEDVTARHQAVHEQQRRTECATVALVAPKFDLLGLPHHILGRRRHHRTADACEVFQTVAGPQDIAFRVTSYASEELVWGEYLWHQLSPPPMGEAPCRQLAPRSATTASAPAP